MQDAAVSTRRKATSSVDDAIGKPRNRVFHGARVVSDAMRAEVDPDTLVMVERWETSPEAGIAGWSSSCGILRPMKISTLFVVGVLGLVLAISCGGTPLSDGGGTGGDGGSTGSGGSGDGGSTGSGGAGGGGGIVDAGCAHLEYASPGCEVSPICTNGTGGACAQAVCGCDGKVLIGCGLFSEPFAYAIPLNSLDGADPAGMTCDPTPTPGIEKGGGSRR